MTERTLSGRSRRRSGARPSKYLRIALKGPKPAERSDEGLGNAAPILWTLGMLLASILLTAAAVFSHKPL
jgi:hypothetical protein